MASTINLYQANVKSAEVRRETMGGREYLVVPVVALVEGVVNGAFVSGEEIEKSIRSWNGRPVSINHPKKNGHYISANNPDVIQGSVVGSLFNASFDDDKFRGEIWVDIPKAEELGGDALAAVNLFESGEMVEVSTAYWADYADRRGTFNGKPYDVSQHNLLPDHLAILLHDEGACSMEDGCGAPRVNRRCSMRINARSTARTPDFNGTEETDWSKPNLGDFISGLGLDADSWEDLTSEEKGKIAAHTLLGSADADTFAEANVLPVVNPATGKLNGPAVRNAIARAPQLGGYSEDAIESAQSRGRALLEEHFGEDMEGNKLTRVLTTNQGLSQDDIAALLRDAVAEVEDGHVWIADIFPDDGFLVYEISTESEGPIGLFRRDFTMAEDGMVELGDRAEVFRRTTYVAEPSEEGPETNKIKRVVNQVLGALGINVQGDKPKETKTMEELIQDLVSNERCDFTAEELQAMPESAVQKIAAQLEAGDGEGPPDDPPQTNAGEPGDAPEWFTQWAEKEEGQRKALAERVDSFAANAEAQEAQEREEIVGRLAANEACQFDADELEDFTTAQLRKLDDSYRARSYAGRGLSLQSGGGSVTMAEAQKPALALSGKPNGNGGD